MVQGTHLTFYLSFFSSGGRSGCKTILTLSLGVLFFFFFLCVFSFLVEEGSRDAASIMMRQEVINAVCVYLARSDITWRGA